MKKHNIVIFPGTFDPITLGHQDLIERAARLFKTVIVAVADNARKSPIFSLHQRVELVKTSVAHCDNVEVFGFFNLLIDFAKQKQASIILRGLRVRSDLEYEGQLAHMNRSLDPEIETLFVTPAQEYAFFNSSMIKEVASLGGDVSKFVHPVIQKALCEYYGINYH